MQSSSIPYQNWLRTRGAMALGAPQVDFTTLGMFIIGIYPSALCF